MSDTTVDRSRGLDLDARQRAMLEEMGVRVWWPVAVPSQPAVPSQVRPVPSPPVPPRPARPALTSTVSTVSPAPATSATSVASTAVATPATRQTTNGAAGVVLVDAPRRLYDDVEGRASSTRGGWLIVADMPPDADGRHGDPLSGDAGRLLDNMLRALHLHGGALPVHLARTHRGAASSRESHPQPFDERFVSQAEALAPKVILAMGPLAAQSLLRSSEPLGRLRGRAVPLDALGGAPVVATYHPAYLLRNMADKARAWADLCLAAGHAT